MENAPGSIPLGRADAVGGGLSDELLGRRAERGIVGVAVGAHEAVPELVHERLDLAVGGVVRLDDHCQNPAHDAPGTAPRPPADGPPGEPGSPPSDAPQRTTFATRGAGRNGIVTVRHRFRYTYRPTSYLFRAVVQSQRGYPYLGAASGLVRLRVRP